MSRTDRTPAPDPDVCVIGAGPAGALIAYKLARWGYDVVVLEAGKRFARSSRDERMERALRPAHYWNAVWDVDESRDAFTSSGPVHYQVNRKRTKGVGGTTLHWGGQVDRFKPKDFEMDTRYGLAHDWPIAYGDLQPFYAEAEGEFGVAGADDDPFGPPRDEPYPMEAFPRSHSDSIFADACSELGITVHAAPHARNSEAYDGRSQCVGFGTCSPVCPSGAKYSADVHVRKAEANGARVIDRAVVQRLEHDDSGDRVTEAVYRTPDGERHAQTAGEFVLATGAIENARLLLLSDSPQHPDGLANSSGVVGKYLMEHPYVGVTGRLDRPTAQHRIGFTTMESHHFYEPDDPPPGAFKIGFGNLAGPTAVELALKQREPLRSLQSAPSDPVGAAVEFGTDTFPIRWGDELRDRIDDATGDWFSVVAEIEVLPQEENRVTLNPDRTDAFGNPVPDVSWGATTDYAEETKSEAFDVLDDIVDELDASVRERRRFEIPHGVGHNSGTTRMGTDPSTSVVDEHLRAHDLENLSIAGSSTFVTLGANQPTLTIGATSLRLAAHLHGSVL